MKQYLKWMLSVLTGVIVIVVCSVAIYNHVKTDQKNSQISAKANSKIVKSSYSPSVGNYMTDLKGKTLYVYTKDSNGLSSCLGACIVVWPPYQTSTEPKLLPANFGYIKRSDTGKFQYTYNSKPLYYYNLDGSSGIKGNQVGGFAIINY